MKESASPDLPVIRSRIPTMPKTSSNFDFRKPVAYDGEAKRAFHNHARRRLKSSPTRSASRRAASIYTPILAA